MFDKDFETFMKSMGISFEPVSEHMCDCGDHKTQKHKSKVYGLHVSVGADGIPHIEEFGDYDQMGWARPSLPQKHERRTKMLSKNIEIIENATENGGKIIAEMPGLEKEDIKITTRDTKIFINASHGSGENAKRVYNEEAVLPAYVDTKSIKASYKNGILEITFDYREDIESNKIDVT